MLIFGLVLVFLVVVSIACGIYFTEKVVHPKVHDYKYCYDGMEELGLDGRAFMESVKDRTEDYTFNSRYGYTLRGVIVRAKDGTDFPDGRQRAVILVHGYNGNWPSMLSYAMIYYNLGFSLVLYDHRWHGESDKGKNAYCSMGRFETDDLVDLASDVISLFPPTCIWGLQGESMGSAISMQALDSLPWLSFCAEDCGFSNMKDQMIATCHMMKLPGFPFVQIGGLLLRTFYGFSMPEVDARKVIEHVNLPVLFSHGDADDFVPTYMARELYDLKPDRKRLHLYAGSTHGMSIYDHKDDYEENLRAFLSDFGVI